MSNNVLNFLFFDETSAEEESNVMYLPYSCSTLVIQADALDDDEDAALSVTIKVRVDSESDEWYEAAIINTKTLSAGTAINSAGIYNVDLSGVIQCKATVCEDWVGKVRVYGKVIG